jgi:hypothetical protein
MDFQTEDPLQIHQFLISCLQLSERHRTLLFLLNIDINVKEFRRYLAILPLLMLNEPVPNHNSILTGDLLQQEFMNTQSKARFLNSTRMDKPNFLPMLDFLVSECGLGGTDAICSGQKLMIFLHALIGDGVRKIGAHESTISLVVHEVCFCFMLHKELFFVKPNLHDPTAQRILSNPRMFPFFQHCIGSLDGSHIPASIDLEEQGPFRNRKGFLSQKCTCSRGF